MKNIITVSLRNSDFIIDLDAENIQAVGGASGEITPASLFYHNTNSVVSFRAGYWCPPFPALFLFNNSMIWKHY